MGLGLIECAELIGICGEETWKNGKLRVSEKNCTH